MNLREGEDYYIERGFFVFTAAFLRRRGYCCASGCRHCPYWPPHSGSDELAPESGAAPCKRDGTDDANSSYGSL